MRKTDRQTSETFLYKLRNKLWGKNIIEWRKPCEQHPTISYHTRKNRSPRRKKKDPSPLSLLSHQGQQKQSSPDQKPQRHECRKLSLRTIILITRTTIGSHHTDNDHKQLKPSAVVVHSTDARKRKIFFSSWCTSLNNKTKQKKDIAGFISI